MAKRCAARSSGTSTSRSALLSARCTAASGASAPWATTRARTRCSARSARSRLFFPGSISKCRGVLRSMPHYRFTAEVLGRAAREALATGEGEVCAVFRRSFYLRSPEGRYACIGDASLGCGPLNGLVSQEGLGCTILGVHNALSVHAQPALEAIDRWLAGNALGNEAAQLIGLGPGLTPSGDDYLGGVLVALRWLGRGAQADSLWRWLEPRLAGQTRAISAAHLAAAASGEVHEALHAVLENLAAWQPPDLHPSLAKLETVGHSSGWDALAGIVAVARTAQ